MSNLEKKFHREVREKTITAKQEYGYNAARFNQMLGEFGAVETAKQLIAKAISTNSWSEGFTFLAYDCHKPELTIEHSVCQPEYKELFLPEEIAYCKRVFEEIGYKI